MKLGKLLSASTSFFGGGDAIAYRLNKGPALPKFNDGKSPFAQKAPEAPEPAKTEVKAAGAETVAPHRAGSETGAPAQKATPPYVARPVAQPAAQAPAKAAKHGWTMRLNPFRAPEPVAAQPPRAVQSELSLDAVKVVHNDLADADVEVVPVKSRANAPVEAPVLAPARQAWEYLGESLLNS